MNLRPLEDRVVIEPLETDSKTPGGIILPDQAKEKPKRGKVLAVGKGRQIKLRTTEGDDTIGYEGMGVEVGDIVHYEPYAGQEITRPDGGKVLVMRESGVIAVEV